MKKKDNIFEVKSHPTVQQIKNLSKDASELLNNSSCYKISSIKL